MMILLYTPPLPHPPEPVSVGLVLKNPLKVPLQMTNMVLIWSHTTPDSSNSSFVVSEEEGPSPRASCDVLDSVLLKPEEERMVFFFPTYMCCIDTKHY